MVGSSTYTIDRRLAGKGARTGGSGDWERDLERRRILGAGGERGFLCLLSVERVFPGGRRAMTDSDVEATTSTKWVRTRAGEKGETYKHF